MVSVKSSLPGSQSLIMEEKRQTGSSGALTSKIR